MPIADRVGEGEVVRLDLPAGHRSPRSPWPFVVLVAAAVFALAYARGGFAISARSVVAIALWWALFLALVLGLVPRARLPRAVLGVAALLSAFTLWTLLSMLWAPTPELAFTEFDRNALYVALFVVVALLGRRRNLGWWIDGLRLGIVAVAVVALVSRSFPHVFAARGIGTLLPNAATRLSFPIGYWNALAVLAAFALPLSLAVAVSRGSVLRRATALSCVPLLVAVVVLASSRGGVLALVAGTAVFVAAVDRRWPALGATAIAAAGSAAAAFVLHENDTLVNGPLGGTVAEHQGRVVAALLIVIAVATGALLVLGERLLRGRAEPPRRLAAALLVALGVAVVAGVLLAHPVRRFDEFRQIPTSGQTAPNFATAHLTSGSGSGRWQFWTAALHEWESAPLIGRGAASYRFWWAQHASFTYHLENAHSLFLEVLGELGVVGFGLLVAAFGWGVVAAIGALRRAAGEQRASLAALLALFAAFLVGASIDWLWQITVVAGVGVAALALLTSCAEVAVREPAPARPGRARLVAGAAILLGSWVVICAEAVPWLTATRISNSQAAVRAGDLGRALSTAADARAIQPWAASPYVQLALVAEARGDRASAVRWIRAALDRDSDNWATWYVASRLEREAGDRAAALEDFRRAESLNVRSPIFATSGRP